MSGLVRALALTPPRSKEALFRYIQYFHSLRMCRRAVCPGHSAPFDYVAGSFFEEISDCVIWASRGGGKTELGALVTHLDSVFKPATETRILGGSLEQSEKMYEYFLAKWQGPFADLLESEPTKRRTRLKNRSRVEILTQSPRSVRGVRVQKVKCDEVDEFHPDVFQAVQFVTQSKPKTGSGKQAASRISSSLQVFSTMHHPFGLMSEVVAKAREVGIPVFKWCLLEVMEGCRDYSCSRCPLAEDCRGTAKEAEGYFPVEDALKIKRRSSNEAWETEMLCKRPSLTGLVYRDFDEDVHLAEIAYREGLGTYAAFDFGYENPFVCLFFQVDYDDRVFLFDEYYVSGKTTEEHARNLLPLFRRYRVLEAYADPSGALERRVLARFGIPTRRANNDIAAGLEAVRSHLKVNPETGRPRLFISRRCKNAIREFSLYRYPDARVRSQTSGYASEIPAKGDDHAMDALRYFLASFQGAQTQVKIRALARKRLF
jgi:hypothetical protein